MERVERAIYIATGVLGAVIVACALWLGATLNEIASGINSVESSVDSVGSSVDSVGSNTARLTDAMEGGPVGGYVLRVRIVVR